MKTLLRFITAIALLTQLRAADLTLSANVDTLLQAADYAAFRTSLAVAALDSPVFTTRFDIEATGVRFTASNGSLTLLGLGNGSDENIVLDFNTTANTLTVSSGTGVTVIDMGAIGLTVGDISGGALTVTSFSVGGVAITASGAELNYTDGVTSAIQTQLNAKGSDSRVIGATWDGAGSVISTGSATGYITVPYAGAITGWSISADTGTATIKIWKVANGTAVPTVANNINTAGVALSSGTHVRSSTVSDFTTTAVTAGDIFAFNLSAVSGATKLTATIEITE